MVLVAKESRPPMRLLRLNLPRDALERVVKAIAP